MSALVRTCRAYQRYDSYGAGDSVLVYGVRGTGFESHSGYFPNFFYSVINDDKRQVQVTHSITH